MAGLASRRFFLPAVAGALAALGVLVLQSTVLQGRLPDHATLDLVFLLTLLVGRAHGAWQATALGLWGGLLTGALRGNLSLPMAVLYGAVGFLAGAYFDMTERDSLMELVSLVTGLSLLVLAGEAILLMWLGLPVASARSMVLPTLLWNIAVVTPLVMLLPPRVR